MTVTKPGIATLQDFNRVIPVSPLISKLMDAVPITQTIPTLTHYERDLITCRKRDRMHLSDGRTLGQPLWPRIPDLFGLCKATCNLMGNLTSLFQLINSLHPLFQCSAFAPYPISWDSRNIKHANPRAVPKGNQGSTLVGQLPFS